jgi:sugar/nucleoside kinase (ribokinase family)
VLVVVDIKTPPLIPLPCHVDYATPNAAEYADAVARVQRRRSARRPARPVDVLHALAGRTTAFARYRRLGAVVVTQGASGAVYNSCGTPIPQPVWVRPGDATPGRYTCGAGDVFVAKFTSELVQGFSLHHAVQAAVDTASHAARTGCFCWS